MTAMRLEARKLLVCSRSSVGSASMMRSMVLVALVVCSVPSTRCPGLGGRHRHGDGLGVAHFADQDHVGILAHRRAHALGEGRQVRAQLALDDLARSCCDGRTRSGSSRLMMLRERVELR